MNQSVSLTDLLLTDIQPSQFYLSQQKLERIQSWLDPSDLSNFAPCPVYPLNGRIIFTDGHTRAYAAYKAGLTKIPLIWETDQLSWHLYQKCVDACRFRGVYSVKDFAGRILSPEEYTLKWLGWCREMQEASAEVLK